MRKKRKQLFKKLLIFLFRCKRGYEGKHCEIESIGSWFSETDVGRIPSDLKILYEKIQPKTKSKLMNKSPKKIIK